MQQIECICLCKQNHFCTYQCSWTSTEVCCCDIYAKRLTIDPMENCLMRKACETAGSSKSGWVSTLKHHSCSSSVKGRKLSSGSRARPLPNNSKALNLSRNVGISSGQIVASCGQFLSSPSILNPAPRGADSPDVQALSHIV
jgi:hypothetical protein